MRYVCYPVNLGPTGATTQLSASSKHDVAHGEIVRWSDVEFDANNETIRTRKAMEAAFAKEG
jgi:hypothetical protein